MIYPEIQTPSGPSCRHSPPALPDGRGTALARGGPGDGQDDGDGAAEADGSTPPGADQVPLGTGPGLGPPDGDDPDGPDPDDPAGDGLECRPAEAAGDAPCCTVTAGCVPGGTLAPPPGDRPGSAPPADRNGAAPTAAGGPAGRGLNRTVTVTKNA